jgi:hypothetical protein
MEQVLKLARTGKVIIPVVILAVIGFAYAYVASLAPEAQEELLWTVQEFLPLFMFSTLALLLFSGPRRTWSWSRCLRSCSWA